MTYTVYGIENVDYERKSDKRRVVGTRLHCTYSDDRISGYGCQAFWCSSRVELPTSLELGSTIQILYNQWGNVESVRIAD